MDNGQRFAAGSRRGQSLLPILLALATLVLAGPASAETRVALVIGNGAYTSKPLRNPRSDAGLMARTLANLGFDVMTLMDASDADMRTAIAEFGRRIADPQSVALFYYAGHGVQARAENYLMPVGGGEARGLADVAARGVALSEVLQVIGRRDGRLNIVLLDACRDNPFAPAAATGVEGLAPVVAPGSTIIGYATAPGTIAFDGAGDNSPYTAALAAAIPSPGATLEDVFRATRRQVMAETANRQIPWEHSSLVSEFWFNPMPPGGVVTGALPQQPSDPRLAEIADWDRVKSSHDPEVFAAHVRKYPDGLFAELASLKISKLTAMRATTPWNWIMSGGGMGDASNSDAISTFEDAVKLDAAAETPEARAAAAKLYAEAADLGLATAQYNLGRAYDKGRGVERNLAEAARWYKRAADQNHVGAMAALATLYEFGDGVGVNMVEALRLYRLSADAGDVYGLTGLAYLYAEGKGVGRDAAEARRLYEMAADKGHARAMFNLSLMLLRGEGGGKDVDRAIRLLAAAAAKGHASAKHELAYLYDEGRGVGKNPKLAASYFLDAVKSKKPSSDAVDEVLRGWSFATRREIQRQLAARGLYNGLVHGFFNAATRRAVLASAAQ